jgi:hypothetical protein
MMSPRKVRNLIAYKKRVPLYLIEDNIAIAEESGEIASRIVVIVGASNVIEQELVEEDGVNGDQEPEVV